MGTLLSSLTANMSHFRVVGNITDLQTWQFNVIFINEEFQEDFKSILSAISGIYTL
jgi:hypothetical protein